MEQSNCYLYALTWGKEYKSHRIAIFINVNVKNSIFFNCKDDALNAKKIQTKDALVLRNNLDFNDLVRF